MVRLISRQRGGLAALKLTKLFGIDDFPAAKDSGRVLIIIIYCYLIIIIVTCQTHADVIRLSVFLEFRQKHPNDILAAFMHFSKGTLAMKEAHLVLFALFLETCFSAIFSMKYIWNNSYLHCDYRWKWRMIIAVNFKI